MSKNQCAGKGINGDADVCGGKGTPEGVSGKRTPEGGAGKNMKQFLLDKIAKRKIVAGVVGLGYVGLPLAVEKAKAGFKTIGFDVQKSKVDSVNAGHNYIGDVVNADLKKLVEDRRLMATEDFSFIKDVDFVAICLCRLYHFPQVNIHLVAEHCHFIYQTYVDVSVSILQYLIHLSDSRTADPIYLPIQNSLIHSGYYLLRIFAYGSNYFWSILCFIDQITGVYALWRKS